MLGWPSRARAIWVRHAWTQPPCVAPPAPTGNMSHLQHALSCIPVLYTCPIYLQHALSYRAAIQARIDEAVWQLRSSTLPTLRSESHTTLSSE